MHSWSEVKLFSTAYAPGPQTSQRLPIYPGLQKDSLPVPQDLPDLGPQSGFVPDTLHVSLYKFSQTK